MVTTSLHYHQKIIKFCEQFPFAKVLAKVDVVSWFRMYPYLTQNKASTFTHSTTTYVSSLSATDVFDNHKTTWAYINVFFTFNLSANLETGESLFSLERS